VQDNQSLSVPAFTLRGLHFQAPYAPQHDGGIRWDSAGID